MTYIEVQRCKIKEEIPFVEKFVHLNEKAYLKQFKK